MGLGNKEGGLPNWRDPLPRPSTTSSRRKSFLAGCSTGDGFEDRSGVGVCVAIGVAVGFGVVAGFGVGVGVGVGDIVGDGIGVGVGVGLGVDVGADDRDGVGNGEGCSTNGSPVGRVSAALVDGALGVGAGVPVDPGSDQSPTLFPLTKVVCNLV